MPSPLDLDRLEAMMEASSCGAVLPDEFSTSGWSPESSAFIAAIVNAAPALLAEVRAAREWLRDVDESSNTRGVAYRSYRALVAANSGGEG